MKNYRIRVAAFVFFGLGIFVLSRFLVGAGIGLHFESGYFTKVEQKDIDSVLSSLMDVSECFLCGKGKQGIMKYFRNRDDLGIVCLNSWNVFEMNIRDLESLEQPIVSSLCTGKKGCKFSRTNHVSRGIAQVNICLGEESFFDIEKMGKSLCQDCLNRLIETTESYGLEAEPEKMYDLCLYDFQTQKLYSLQPANKGYYVRDYYIHIDYSGEHMEVIGVYAPETGRKK